MSDGLTLHVLAPSHPSRAARRALELKGLEFELVELAPGSHVETIAGLYGEGKMTVPGMLVGDEPVHGSRAIFARLDRIQPDPPLYPEPIAEAVRAADRWGEEELQPLGRSLGWGALHFRPELLGTLLGGEPLDPVGTDRAMGFIHGAWKHHRISCARISDDLAALPGLLDHVDELIAEGVIGNPQLNAADLQIGATLQLLYTLGDIRGMIEGRAAQQLAHGIVDDWAGTIPAGAFPASWIPATAAAG